MCTSATHEWLFKANAEWHRRHICSPDKNPFWQFIASVNIKTPRFDGSPPSRWLNFCINFSHSFRWHSLETPKIDSRKKAPKQNKRKLLDRHATFDISLERRLKSVFGALKITTLNWSLKHDIDGRDAGKCERKMLTIEGERKHSHCIAFES